MGFIITIVIIALAVVILPRLFGEKSQKQREHNNVHELYTPIALRFGFNPDAAITKNQIDEGYSEKREKVKNNEDPDYDNLAELEADYKELLRLGEKRDRLMAEISGRRIEFFD
ncbi:MAG: hypothetical protein R2824_08410 [Saprospiraceae bacterium]